MMTDEVFGALKPCPFCDSGEAVGMSERGSGSEVVYAVGCATCGAFVEGRFWERSRSELPGFLMPGEAVEAWNRRVGDEPSARDSGVLSTAQLTGDKETEPSAAEGASHREAGDK